MFYVPNSMEQWNYITVNNIAFAEDRNLIGKVSSRAPPPPTPITIVLIGMHVKSIFTFFFFLYHI